MAKTVNVLTACFCFSHLADGARLKTAQTGLAHRANPDEESALCDPDMIGLTCAAMRDAPADVASASANDAVATADLAQLLSTSTQTIATFMSDVLQVEEGLTCKNLCHAVVDYLGKHTTLPPAHDVGCYHTSLNTIVCGQKLDSQSLAAEAEGERDLPDFGDDERIAAEEAEREFDKVISAAVELEDTPQEMPSETSDIHYESVRMATRVANLFSIYPATTASVPTRKVVRKPKNGIKRRLTPGVPAWAEAVQKINLKAQTWLTKGMLSVKTNRATELIHRWFGATAAADTELKGEVERYRRTARRKAVLRVLNGIDEMLGNVAYAKGVGCAANTFAWVYPKSGKAGDPNAVKAKCAGKFPVDGEKCVKNSENKFLFYLCPLYFNSNESTQLETQLHEASHHATAFTSDVCMEECYPGRNSSVIVQQPVRDFPGKFAGDLVWAKPPASYHFPQQFVSVGRRARQRSMAKILHKTLDSVTLEFFNDGPNCPSQFKAYGRRPCLDLAVIEPRKAIINADNLCYFVTDVVAGHVGQVSAQECTHGFCFGTKVSYSGERVVDQDGAVIDHNHTGVVIYQTPDALADVADVLTLGGLTADEAAAEAVTEIQDLTDKFAPDNKVWKSSTGNSYLCCCQSAHLDLFTEPSVECELVDTDLSPVYRYKSGCGGLKGDGFHSWNSMATISKYSSFKNVGKCVVPRNTSGLATLANLTLDTTVDAKFAFGDKVYVSGQPATVKWDGRPGSNYSQVTYQFSGKTDFVPVSSISLNDKVFIYVRFDGTRLPVKVLAELVTGV